MVSNNGFAEAELRKTIEQILAEKAEWEQKRQEAEGHLKTFEEEVNALQKSVEVLLRRSGKPSNGFSDTALRVAFSELTQPECVIALAVVRQSAIRVADESKLLVRIGKISKPKNRYVITELAIKRTGVFTKVSGGTYALLPGAKLNPKTITAIRKINPDATWPNMKP